MKETDAIVNRVAGSGLITLDLAEYYHPGARMTWDMADYLYQGLILREKDFRQALRDTDWSEYQGANVAVVCSGDAIIPSWAYMLVITHLSAVCHKAVIGSMETLEYALFSDALSKIDVADFRDAKVVIKGCGDVPVPESAYGALTALLVPVVTSLMFGEPCSTVPVYKRKVQRR